MVRGSSGSRSEASIPASPFSEARRAAGRSLELCRTIGFAYGVGLAERNLGRLALAAGAPRRGVCGLQALEGVRSCIPTFPTAVSDVGMPDLVARADELARSSGGPREDGQGAPIAPVA